MKKFRQRITYFEIKEKETKWRKVLNQKEQDQSTHLYIPNRKKIIKRLTKN
jgi:hypothetical protein